MIRLPRSRTARCNPFGALWLALAVAATVGLAACAPMHPANYIAQKMASSSCEKFKAWFARVPPPAATRQYGFNHLLPLVEDGVFVPSFGKAYGSLTLVDFRESQQSLARCAQAGLLTPAEMTAAQQVWNQGTQATILQQQAARQTALAELTSIRRQLEDLPPEESSLERLRALQARGSTLTASPQYHAERASFQQLASDTNTRLRTAIETQRANDAIANAEGGNGLIALATARERLNGAGLPRELSVPLLDKLATRMAELAEPAMAAERRNMVAPGRGLPALAANASALRAFESRYARVFALVPTFAAARGEARAARQPWLPVAFADVAAQVARARDPAGLEALVTTHFLDDELRSGVGAELRSSANARSALLKRIARDVVVFGPQPEHEGLLAGKSAAAPEARPSVGVGVGAANPTRCDTLAAHPLDPERLGPGVPDAKLDAKAAIVACTQAVSIEPRSGRLQFQLGRALLESARVNEALTALKRAVELQHGGAYHYMSEAYASGAPGLPKNDNVAAQYAEKADALGFGRSSAAGEPQFADADYEDAKLMRAVYFGDTSLLGDESAYAYAYLIAQADLLANECNAFKLTEVQAFRNAALRKALPGSERDAMRMGQNLMVDSFKAMAEIMRNPKVIADISARSQRAEMAPVYGGKDLVQLAGSTNGCQGTALKRYTKNLRTFLSR